MKKEIKLVSKNEDDSSIIDEYIWQCRRMNTNENVIQRNVHIIEDFIDRFKEE